MRALLGAKTAIMIKFLFWFLTQFMENFVSANDVST